MSSTKIAAYLIASLLVGVLAVQYVRAVQPAIAHERYKAAAAACAKVPNMQGEIAPPLISNPTLGRFPRLAPDFQAMDYTGKMVPLSAYRGKVVFLNFWATWCGTCREEMPSMDKLQRQLGTNSFTILAVASDDAWKKIHDYFPKGTAMSVLLDPPEQAEHEGGIAGTYGTTKLPETYLIDKDGNLRYYFVSTRNWADPRAIACIKALIAE